MHKEKEYKVMLRITEIEIGKVFPELQHKELRKQRNKKEDIGITLSISLLSDNILDYIHKCWRIN